MQRDTSRAVNDRCTALAEAWNSRQLSRSDQYVHVSKNSLVVLVKEFCEEVAKMPFSEYLSDSNDKYVE